MDNLLNDIPIVKAIPSIVDAAHYNRVFLAISRLQAPIRIELLNLRGLDILIESDAWVCVDRTISDAPILAWTDFDVSQRKTLGDPVSCQLRFFHAYTETMCGTVLDIVHRSLDARLTKLRRRSTSRTSYLYNKLRRH